MGQPMQMHIRYWVEIATAKYVVAMDSIQLYEINH